MIEFSYNNIDFSYDIEKEVDRKQLIETILIMYRQKFPFFINMLLFLCDILDVEEEMKDTLAYTQLNGKKERIDIFINFKLIEKLELKPIVILGLIFHELLHNYYYHFDRFEEERKLNPEAINVATDYYVNACVDELIQFYTPNNMSYIDILEKAFLDKLKQETHFVTHDMLKNLCDNMKISGLPDNKTLREDWIDRDLYEFFKNNFPKQYVCNVSSMGNTIDDHDKNSQTNKDKSNNEKGENILDDAAIKEIMRSKIEVAENEMQQYLDSDDKQNGSERNLFNRKIRILKPNYFLNMLKLKRVITKALSCGKVFTYQKPNRKRQKDNIIFKGKKKENGLKLIIGIDVSGSVSDEELQNILDMLYGLNKKKKEFLFDIIYWSNNDIKENKTFTDNVTDIRKFAQTNVYSTGGTDIITFHEYLSEKYKNIPFEVINITDGYFCYDKTLPDKLQKYHFVLTEKPSDSFKEYYRDSKFNIVEVKQQNYR